LVLHLMKLFQGWNAYVSWANSFKLKKNILRKIAKIKHKKIDEIIKRLKEENT